MKIISYQYWDSSKAKWQFSRVELGKVNLLVGDTGTGKTRFLNTVFNLGLNARGKSIPRGGCWSVEFKIKNQIYGWEIESEAKTGRKFFIKHEHIWKKSKGKKISIVKRDESTFKLNGKKVPKLPRDSTSVSLLKEEEVIKPLYEGFGKIMRRHFSEDVLRENTAITSIDPEIIETGADDLSQLFVMELGLDAKLYFLSKRFTEIYKTLCSYYQNVFPFIKNVKIMDLRKLRPKLRSPVMVPVFCIKEKGVDDWLPASELSSGMQKVLLILTDVLSFPDPGIYLIDEYENSLGINAIDFFPTFVSDLEKDIQFILTSHHPYLVNNIPVKDWLVFHRKGSDVKIRYGKDNVDRFSKSKQQRFIQLINDPFYTEGIE